MKTILIIASVVAVAVAEAPYTASGWRPSGKQFLLPSRLSATYQRPSNEYGPPPAPAVPSTTTEAETTTTELPTTTQSDAEDRNAALTEGVYYVLQPGGRLQRIAYAHGPASAPAQLQQQQNPGYLARFHYHDLEPVGAPIYSYASPQLVRVN